MNSDAAEIPDGKKVAIELLFWELQQCVIQKLLLSVSRQNKCISATVAFEY